MSRPGDDWGQEAVLDDLMAAFGPGPDDDPPDDSSGPGLDVGPELDEFLDGPGPEGAPPGESAGPVPESMDAGFLPRGGTGRPKLVGGGRGAGFASGAELDRALPGPALAGFADDAAGSDRRYRGLDDDQLIGALLGWQKTEAWALLGLAERPGEAGGFGPIDPDLARAMADSAATHPATTWCLTVTDSHGHPTAHGCARPTRRAGPPPPGSRTGPGRGATGPGHRTRHESEPAGRAAGPPKETGPPGRPGRYSEPGRSGAGPPGGTGTDSRPGGYGTLRLQPVPGGPDLTVDLEPIAVTDCDHRHQTSAHDPSARLRRLVQIRDGECTPPCRRNARRCDFEHAIPWENGGVTCACNAGPPRLR